ncbi:MAG: hypothetical protein KGJ60_12985 [Verrucomicrobiota bacterium]|nr:hypothetical protein [Verrucomicrobiota bacterium]
MFEQGDTFFGGAELHGKDHPWVIINDPAQHGGQALYVNITSLKGGRFDDLTCVLHAGEHPSVSHASYNRRNAVDTSCQQYKMRRPMTMLGIFPARLHWWIVLRETGIRRNSSAWSIKFGSPVLAGAFCNLSSLMPSPSRTASNGEI